MMRARGSWHEGDLLWAGGAFSRSARPQPRASREAGVMEVIVSLEPVTCGTDLSVVRSGIPKPSRSRCAMSAGRNRWRSSQRWSSPKSRASGEQETLRRAALQSEPHEATQPGSMHRGLRADAVDRCRSTLPARSGQATECAAVGSGRQDRQGHRYPARSPRPTQRGCGSTHWHGFRECVPSNHHPLRGRPRSGSGERSSPQSKPGANLHPPSPWRRATILHSAGGHRSRR